MSSSSRLVQVTNVSTSVTKEQFRSFFAHLGRIDEMHLYPESETLTATVAAKVGYVRYDRPESATAALNLTTTIFLDRPVICSLVRPSSSSSSSSSVRIPDETEAMKLCPTVNSSINFIPGGPTWPHTVTNRQVNAGATSTIETLDPSMAVRSLPMYPSLPGSTEQPKVEEIRRTVYVSNLDPRVTFENLHDLFSQIGEIKYMRMTRSEQGREFESLGMCGNLVPDEDESITNDSVGVYIEFSEQPSVVKALCLNGLQFAGRTIKVNHSTQAVIIPATSKEQISIDEIRRQSQKSKPKKTESSSSSHRRSHGKRSSSGKHSSSRHRHDSKTRKSKKSGDEKSGESESSGSDDEAKSDAESDSSRERASPPRKQRKASRSRSKSKSRKSRSPSAKKKRSRSREKDRKEKTKEKEKEKDKDKDKHRSEKDKDKHRGSSSSKKRDEKEEKSTSSSSKSKDKYKDKDRDKVKEKKEKDKDKEKSSKSDDKKSSKRRSRSKSRDRDKKKSSGHRKRSRSRSRSPKSHKSKDHKSGGSKDSAAKKTSNETKSSGSATKLEDSETKAGGNNKVRDYDKEEQEMMETEAAREASSGKTQQEVDKKVERDNGSSGSDEDEGSSESGEGSSGTEDEVEEKTDKMETN